MSESGFFKGLLIGGLMGLAAGILIAPKSGRETRADICNRTEELVRKARDEYSRGVEKTCRTFEYAKAHAQEAMHSAVQATGEIREEAAGMAEAGREKLDETGSRLKRALDAGIQAYQDAKKE